MTFFIHYDCYENVAEQKNQSCLPWCGIQKAVDYRIIPIDSPLPKNFPPFLALKQYIVKVQNLSDVASEEVMTSLVPKHQMHPRLSSSSLAPFCLCLSLSACNAEWACKCVRSCLCMCMHVWVSARVSRLATGVFQKNENVIYMEWWLDSGQIFQLPYVWTHRQMDPLVEMHRRIWKSVN